ncbi:MAG: hypothetical protein IPO22_14715 [Anaerolineales bacterium]|nr:hypothetical protein [Anaerolineales bacterium]
MQKIRSTPGDSAYSVASYPIPATPTLEQANTPATVELTLPYTPATSISRRCQHKPS